MEMHNSSKGLSCRIDRDILNLEYFRKVFGELPGLFHLLDENGFILEVNQIWLKVMGYPKEKVIGKNFMEFVFPDDREIARSCFKDLKKEEDVGDINLRVMTENGDKLVFSFNGKIIHDNFDSNKIIFCHMKIVTITDAMQNKIENKENLVINELDANIKMLNLMHVLAISDEIQNIKHKNERLLYDAAIKFSEISYEGNIYDLIAKELKLIIPDAYIIIVSHNTEADVYNLVSFEGFGELFGSVLKILKLDVLNMSYKMRDDIAIQKIKTRKLIKDEEGISKLTGGGINPKMAKIFTEFLGVGNLYYIGFVKNDIIFGGAGILLKKGNTIENIQTIETLVYQASIALQKREIEKLLRESEENIRNIYDSVNDAIFIHDYEGNINEANNKACEMLDYTKEELLNKNIFDLMPSDHIKWIKSIHNELLDTTSTMFETIICSKKGNLINVEFNSKLIKFKDKILILSVSRELRYKNRDELDLKEIQTKYQPKAGNFYLFNDENNEIAFDLFNSFLNSDYRGYIISRLNKNKYSRIVKNDFEYFQLTKNIFPNKINPSFFDLLSFIENIGFRSVIIIDSFYYILLENDLKDLFLFIDTLKNIGQFKKHYYFIFLKEEEVGKKIFKIVQNECIELEEKQIQKLPNDIMNILQYIRAQNNIGVAPTLTEIIKKQKSSRPTVGKKVKDLILEGYIKSYKVGKNVHFELTKEGLKLFEY